MRLLILLAFSGFLHFNELCHIKCTDIHFTQDYVKLIIPKSKTDQYRQGNEVLIAKTGNNTCPYAMLLKYIESCSVNIHTNHYLFKPMYGTKSGAKLIQKNKSISYTAAKESILSRLGEVSDHGIQLGLHSLRSGGATAAAHAQINDRCWKRHGRWRSDTSKDRYVKDSVSHRLAVSKCLGL